MQETKTNIHSLMKKPYTEEKHSILNTDALQEPEINSEGLKEDLSNLEEISVWPVDSNIIIEEVEYNDNSLIVKLNNLAVNLIKIISMGVKYTSSDEESIEFEPTNIVLHTGNSTIRIPCQKGNPFKFVIRTANKTGVGQTKDNINW